jgi:hypothetical protein
MRMAVPPPPSNQESVTADQNDFARKMHRIQVNMEKAAHEIHMQRSWDDYLRMLRRDY